ncbi:MAG: hypothetical protein AB7S78_10405 [Candidatus Omnitrophota bacterium]
MNIKTLLIAVFMVNSIWVSDVFAYTKTEVENLLHEKISDEEYELIIEEAEASKKSIPEIFDEVIDPKREKEMLDSVKGRQYILPSEKNFRGTEKNSELNGAAVSTVVEEKPLDDEKPITVKQPKIQKKSLVYDGEQESNNDRLNRKKEESSSSGSEKMKDKASPSEREDAEREASFQKNKKEIDRKSDVYRSSEQRKKIEDYNRTKKKKKFGGKRLDDEVPDEGYETKAFKKKEFGAKIISEKKNKRFDGPAKDFEEKGFKRKMLRNGTVSNNDRKTSMFGKDKEEEDDQ